MSSTLMNVDVHSKFPDSDAFAIDIWRVSCATAGSSKRTQKLRVVRARTVLPAVALTTQARRHSTSGVPVISPLEASSVMPSGKGGTDVNCSMSLLLPAPAQAQEAALAAALAGALQLQVHACAHGGRGSCMQSLMHTSPIEDERCVV